MRYIIGKQWLFFSMASSSPCIQRWNVQVCPSIYSTPTNWSKPIMVFSLSMPMVARWCLQSYPVSAESLPGKVFLILRKRCRKKKVLYFSAHHWFWVWPLDWHIQPKSWSKHPEAKPILQEWQNREMQRPHLWWHCEAKVWTNLEANLLMY